MKTRRIWYLLDDGQNPGLGVVVTIGADDQIHLLIVGILAKRLRQPKERILGGGGHDGGREDGGAVRTHVV